MKYARYRLLAASSVATLLAGWASPAWSQAASAASTSVTNPAPSDNVGIADIVVTAQKRSESINKVPLTITAASGDLLVSRGIQNTADLVKVVSGFNAVDSSYGNPVYYLRGVGFFDTALGSKPTVSVYVDEAPLPFSAMTFATTYDLERVEVLKGPQGTLFGQNATGGAINYIAAKPTDHFTAGADVSYGRFNMFDGTAYISGPVSSTLSARLAVMHQGGGAYQQSLTRPGDTLGNRDLTAARLLFKWTPSDRLTINLNVNGFINKSDVLASQLVGKFQGNPDYDDVALREAPLASANARSADWGYSYPPHRNDHMIQVDLRADYQLVDNLTLTSLTSYARLKNRFGLELDGTAAPITDGTFYGRINTISQELRASLNLSDRGTLILGGNFGRDKTYQDYTIYFPVNSAANAFAAFGLPAADYGGFRGGLDYRSYAAFGNIDYDILSELTLHLGGRYTQTTTTLSDACAVTRGNNTIGIAINALLGLPPGTIQPDDCYVIQPDTSPGAPAGALTVGSASGRLKEHNFSWRAGLDYKPVPGIMFYASVSRGYKGGAFPVLAGTSIAQYTPVKQESVTAYEIGFKGALFDRHVQLNAALFYYDYADKQLKSKVPVFPFGPLDTLINVPKSRVQGAELNVMWQPTKAFSLNAGGTYVDSKVTSHVLGYTNFGVQEDFKGSRFPYTSKLQLNADVAFEPRLNDRLNLYTGADVTYRSKSNSDFIPNPVLDIKSYALVGFRAGVRAEDSAWRAGFFVKNLFNKYYWTATIYNQDTLDRYAGQPRIFGVNASYRFR